MSNKRIKEMLNRELKRRREKMERVPRNQKLALAEVIIMERGLGREEVYECIDANNRLEAWDDLKEDICKMQEELEKRKGLALE